MAGGGGPGAAVVEPYRFRERHLDEVRAASGRPAGLVDGEMASWYGSRAATGLRYLAALRRRLASGHERPPVRAGAAGHQPGLAQHLVRRRNRPVVGAADLGDGLLVSK